MIFFKKAEAKKVVELENRIKILELELEDAKYLRVGVVDCFAHTDYRPKVSVKQVLKLILENCDIELEHIPTTTRLVKKEGCRAISNTR